MYIEQQTILKRQDTTYGTSRITNGTHTSNVIEKSRKAKQ